jgi:hypothetical protein
MYGTAGEATGENIIRRMRIACCMHKATNTHSKYIIRTAFPLQQWLHERASMLRYTYIVFIVCLAAIIVDKTLTETVRARVTFSYGTCR